jgi:hypothetical protein
MISNDIVAAAFLLIARNWKRLRIKPQRLVTYTGVFFKIFNFFPGYLDALLKVLTLTSEVFLYIFSVLLVKCTEGVLVKGPILPPWSFQAHHLTVNKRCSWCDICVIFLSFYNRLKPTTYGRRGLLLHLITLKDTHSLTRAHTHTHIHTHTHACTNIYTHAHTRSHSTHTHLHTHAHTRSHSTHIHTLTHTHTFGRTPPDEGSARRRDLYMTTVNIHKRQSSIPRQDSNPQF